MTPNPQQQKVIDHFEGPCLVTAVPGSGKTACVTERTSKLLSMGVNPASILAITFTNKAANEMRSRIAKRVGKDKAKLMTISTFHSLCARIVRENASLLGYTRGYSIYDSDDQWRALRTAIIKVEGEPKDGGELPISQKYAKSILYFIEGSRNCDLTYEKAIKKWPVRNAKPIIDAYYKELKDSNAIDFTGLLSEALRLLRDFPEVLDKYRQQWRFISVDEVQDTNISQYELVKLLGSHKNVLCVGDSDQAIYGFRNAEPANVLKFERDFKAKPLKLETNYRSTPQILKHAHALIKTNQDRKDSELRTDNEAGTPPKAYVLDSDYEMADWIALRIKDLIRNKENPDEIAVFYRVNYVSRLLEGALRKYQIPFKVYGDVGFFKRIEIKISLSILRLLVNPNDKTAFETVANNCCRGVGSSTCSSIYDKAEEMKCDVVSAARAYAKGKSRKAKCVAVLTDNFDQSMKPYDLVDRLLHKTAFKAAMVKKSSPDNDRVANVGELVLEIQQFMANGAPLEDYLQYVALLTSQDDKKDSGKVKLMTMHKCKGLEFDNVFISYANEGFIPHSRAHVAPTQEEVRRQLEEERRLMYVSMTRARKRLRIASCKMMGKKEMEPSSFLLEAGLVPAHIKS